MSDDELDTLLFLSFRYALGRKTYIVDQVADLLIKYRDKLHINSIRQIKTEIAYAIETNDAGMDCDVDSWNKVSRQLEG